MPPVRYWKSAENIPSLCNSLDPSGRRAVPSSWRDLLFSAPSPETKYYLAFKTPLTQRLLNEAPRPPGLSCVLKVPGSVSIYQVAFLLSITCLPCQT